MIKPMKGENPVIKGNNTFLYVFDYSEHNYHGHPQYYHENCGCLCNPYTGRCLKCGMSINDKNTQEFLDTDYINRIKSGILF